MNVNIAKIKMDKNKEEKNNRVYKNVERKCRCEMTNEQMKGFSYLHTIVLGTFISILKSEIKIFTLRMCLRIVA